MAQTGNVKQTFTETLAHSHMLIEALRGRGDVVGACPLIVHLDLKCKDLSQNCNWLCPDESDKITFCTVTGAVPRE